MIESKTPLVRLRQCMAEAGIDSYIITKQDPHLSEYAPEYWNAVKFICGFTGSAGTVVVTKNKAVLFTDGRYAIQAEKELFEGFTFSVDEKNPDDYLNYAVSQTPNGSVLAFDGRTLSNRQAKLLIDETFKKGVTVDSRQDLISAIWDGRPALSFTPVYEHGIKFCGVSRIEKINRVREKMALRDAELYLISSLDDIAWLLNLRGSEVPNSTLFASYCVVEPDTVTLFIENEKIVNVKAQLAADNVILMNYNELDDYLNSKPDRLHAVVSLDRTSYYAYSLMSRFAVGDIPNITTELKAVKNETELDNLHRAHVRDGVCMVKFIKWLKNEVLTRSVSEYEVSQRIDDLRSGGENYLFPSFDTIAGYMGNAAMMHYKAKESDCALCKNEGFLLVDSGGNYLDGTTDITRTIVLGEISEQMRRDFTLVLKGHIAVARAVFLEGCTGTNLDILARRPLWEHGIDYKSGTGHGVGFCLNVHEGPHNLSQRLNPFKFLPGMIITNEPGIYRKDEYGIRTENMLLVEHWQTNENGRFLRFKTISYCPIDLRAVDFDMLDNNEKQWLEDYHRMVYNELSPHLSEEEKTWLINEITIIK